MSSKICFYVNYLLREPYTVRHSKFSISMRPRVNTIPSSRRRRACSSPLFPGSEIIPLALTTLCQGTPVPTGRL